MGKIAGVVAAKTFYVGFFEEKITGIVPVCKNTVDATQSKSVAGMVKYFNTAAIEGKTPDEAKLAAAAAYVPLLLKDLGADPGEACIKSQLYQQLVLLLWFKLLCDTQIYSCSI